MQKRAVKIYNKGTNKLPEYKTELSAGFDIRADLSNVYSLNDLKGNTKVTYTNITEKTVNVLPHGRVLIPTGLHVAIPDGYELQIRPRSGSAIDNGITLCNSVGTLDADYRGELKLIILNTDSDETFDIKHGDRLAQGVLKQVEQAEWEEVGSIEELGDTDRGQGGFGHSGKK